MEALVALGLASNVIQFVDFAGKLISTAHTFYISATGTTAENAGLGALAMHIRVLADKASPPIPTSNLSGLHVVDQLHDLGRQCREVSDELLSLLATFNLQGRHKTWKSVYQALRTSRHAAALEAIQRCLDRISSQMNSHLLIHRQEEFLSKLLLLEHENSRLGAARVKDLQDLRIQITDMFKKLEENRRDDRSATRTETLVQLCPSADKVLQFTQEQQILKTLRFDGMDDRHIAFHPAHERTFPWVLDSPNSDSGSCEGSDFADWLKSDGSLYWVRASPVPAN
ncbi:hypothetical protein B0H66DRAFT_17685 [Apodospora peruviana]|uniref:Fungal N-terminal domain-containing protein n=1 Tax=Apodospora peruviana TaxID=516989 RepID=A0AAE0MEZ6_9PEZI|nr:hypothetical protein B0H66DRAFT_17685 [Apodospora peruviana]